jgi:hypothetical protein
VCNISDPPLLLPNTSEKAETTVLRRFLSSSFESQTWCNCLYLHGVLLN